jgi:NAD(P)-dependent dehydrogenase (short-subunit alcohol dehydrogenase family)
MSDAVHNQSVKKVALITGASRGIGAATAKKLAQQGYAICINYNNNKLAAQKLQQELMLVTSKVVIKQADVSDEQQVVALFKFVDQELGLITALVNNAGILKPQTRVENLDAQRINEILITNVTSCFLCCREAVKRMSTKHGGNGGAIVNVGSGASRSGAPGEYVDYAASKGAVDSMTTGLSLEVAGEGVRVNGVRPGFIYTDMHSDGGEPGRVDRLAPLIPMQRGGEASEVAAAISWLLSDEASYATGTFIDVAGGR